MASYFVAVISHHSKLQLTLHLFLPHSLSLSIYSTFPLDYLIPSYLSFSSLYFISFFAREKMELSKEKMYKIYFLATTL